MSGRTTRRLWFTFAMLVGHLIACETCSLPAARGAEIELPLRTRDLSGRAVTRPEKVDPAKVGIVVVDMWNYHWCKTATMRVGALVPRMNRVLDAARNMGMTVMLCPSDVVDNYVGWPQREVIFAMPRHPVPPLTKVECPTPPNAGGCACGREKCVGNYGWDAMHPDLTIAAADLMPDTLDDVYSICQERGLTHLVYFGVHTQVCLLGKSMGLRNLKAAGLQCVLARDLTDAHPGYDLARGLTPDGHTVEVVEHFEKYLAPSVNMVEMLTALGKWDPAWVVDPVRVTPWGTPARPHVFGQDVTITLSAPWQPGAEIRYTLDGSAPTTASSLYTKPFTLDKTTRLRAGAFQGGKPVCLESEGFFARLPELPPLPDLHLADVTPARSVGPSHTYQDVPRFSAHSKPPQKNTTNEGQTIRLRGTAVQKRDGGPRPVPAHVRNQVPLSTVRRARGSGRIHPEDRERFEPGTVPERRLQGVSRRQGGLLQPGDANLRAALAVQRRDPARLESPQPRCHRRGRRQQGRPRQLGRRGFCDGERPLIDERGRGACAANIETVRVTRL